MTLGYVIMVKASLLKLKSVSSMDGIEESTVGPSKVSSASRSTIISNV